MARIGLVVCMMVLAVAAGCQQGELKPQGQPVIADVPWPEGCIYDEAASRSEASAGTRYVDHLYKGSCGKYDVQRFYEKHMAANQWTQLRHLEIRGEVLLWYRKGNEFCLVSISDGGLLYRSRIRVMLMNVGWASPATQ